MNREKMIGDYVFTIEGDQARGIPECDIPICEFDFSTSSSYSVDVVIYGDNIFNYFSKLNPFDSVSGRSVLKSDCAFNCAIRDGNDTLIAEMKSTIVVEYNHIPDTEAETVTMRCDFFEITDKTKESVKLSEMVKDANRKAEEEARKWMISPNDIEEEEDESIVDNPIFHTALSCFMGGLGF